MALQSKRYFLKAFGVAKKNWSHGAVDFSKINIQTQ